MMRKDAYKPKKPNRSFNTSLSKLNEVARNKFKNKLGIKQGVLAVKGGSINLVFGMPASALIGRYDELFRLVGENKFQIYNKDNCTWENTF